MISQEVCVKNPTGLHARPANVFVKTAARFPCKVNLQKGARTFNGKSIVSVLSACVKCGTQITIVCVMANRRRTLCGPLWMRWRAA